MIAVDAMGGDHAPDSIVKGAVIAAQKGIPVLLCGDQDSITEILDASFSLWRNLPISIEHAFQTIGMDEEPSWAVRTKKDSSLVVAVKAVAQGRAQACVSAGNSGATLVAGIFHSGRVPGVMRPAIGSFLPTKNGTVYCIDLGGNVDCKADYLYQFGVMGYAYVSLMKGIAKPRVALLSNGHEPYKGSAEVKKAYDLFKQSSLNFVGNIEARELFDGGVDVVVCDGFVGNVFLKSIQGMAQTFLYWIKDEQAKQSWIKQALFSLHKGIFDAVKKKVDYESIGGALLLGVEHPIVVAHGRSDEWAIANAIQYAHAAASSKQLARFNETLQSMLTNDHGESSPVEENSSSFLG